MLADMLTMRDHSARPLAGVSYCYAENRLHTIKAVMVATAGSGS